MLWMNSVALGFINEIGGIPLCSKKKFPLLNSDSAIVKLMYVSALEYKRSKNHPISTPSLCQ